MCSSLYKKPPYRLQLEIQGLPKTQNRQIRAGGWRAVHAEAKKWKQLVGWEIIAAGGPPAKPFDRARLTLTRFSSSEPDFDGMVASFKACIDGLKAHGVIADDKMSVIGQPTYVWEKCKSREGKVRIVVEQIED